MAVASELRHDPLHDMDVIIAPARARRPLQVEPVFEAPQLRLTVHGRQCVFCPSRLNLKLALMFMGQPPHWDMVVLPNKYPAVSLGNPKAYGTQEVVVETPHHRQQLEELPVRGIEQLLQLYGQRTVSLFTNPRLKYLLIFKNSGGRAGASVTHSHSQIFATGFVPPHVLAKARHWRAYRRQTGRCFYCDVAKRERKTARLVYADRHFIAFTPFASLHTYELWLMPLRHVRYMAELTLTERRIMATLLKRYVRLVSHQLGLAYNYYLHQVPGDQAQHLYLKLTPRGSTWGPVEIGSRIIINPVAPETAARFYRGG